MAIIRKDEVLGKALATDDTIIPRYKLVKEDGSVVAEHVELQLENPILQEGMPYNKDFANEVLAASGMTGGALPDLTLAQNGFELVAGELLRIQLHVGVPANSTLTLNVDNTGALDVVTTDSSRQLPELAQNTVISLAYDGARYVLQGIQKTSPQAAAVGESVTVTAPDTSPLTWGVSTEARISTPILIPADVSPTGVDISGFITFFSDGSGSILGIAAVSSVIVKRFWTGSMWYSWGYAAAGNEMGAANYATQLSSSRSIQTNLASTAAASFNGTANITPGVTGTLPISSGGTGRTDGINPANVLTGTLAAAVYSVAADVTGGIRSIYSQTSAGAAVATRYYIARRK